MESINTNNYCDKCGRSLEGKSYLLYSGWKICGICQWEKEQNLSPNKLHTAYDLNKTGFKQD